MAPTTELQGVTKRQRQRYQVHKAPAAAPGEARKPFTVLPGCSLTDEDGVKRKAGETVMLSAKMAEYMAKRNMIEVSFNFDGDTGLKDENADLRRRLAELELASAGKAGVDGPSSAGAVEASGSEVVSNGDEASAGDNPDSIGAEPSGGDGEDTATETDGEDASPRRRARKL